YGRIPRYPRRKRRGAISNVSRPNSENARAFSCANNESAFSFGKRPQNTTVIRGDAVISISSFEHDHYVWQQCTVVYAQCGKGFFENALRAGRRIRFVHHSQRQSCSTKMAHEG